jgi:three-Cys-motif partner protein
VTDATHEFGGAWTEEKLRRLSAYLAAYNTALKKQTFRRLYIDAFAGTGDRTAGTKRNARQRNTSLPSVGLFGPIAEKTLKVMKGSAQRALEVVPPFHTYIFIEKNRRKFAALNRLKTEYPGQADQITLISDDANAAIKKICKSTDWNRSRAVMFLDPFGMQVDWTTLEAIAQTEAVDLWYLVPVGMGIVRLTTRSGKIPPKWEARLNRMLGEAEWRDAFYIEEKLHSLFHDGTTARKIKTTDTAHVERYLVTRLKSIFPFVAEHGLVLRNSRNQPMFLLMFACANKRGGSIALRIAQHVLGKQGGNRGHV